MSECIKSMGIDPGSRTGIAVVGLHDRMYDIVDTVAADLARDRIAHILDADEDHEIKMVGVEYQERTHIYERPGVSVRGHMKIAQNVERNRTYAREILAMAPAYPWIKFYQVDPYKMGLKTKLTKDLVEAIYGYEAWKKSSSHSRDAIMIAWAAASLYKWEEELREIEGKNRIGGS